MTRRNITLLPTTNKLFPVWLATSNPAFLILNTSCKSLLETQCILCHTGTCKCRTVIPGICPTSLFPPKSRRLIWSLTFHCTNRTKTETQQDTGTSVYENNPPGTSIWSNTLSSYKSGFSLRTMTCC